MQSASGRWTMDRQIYSIRRTKCGKICGKKTWKKMWKEEMEKRREKKGKNWGKTWIGIFLRKKRGLAPDERTACRKNKESVDKK